MRRQRENKFMVLSISVVLAFASCWLPFSIYASIFVYRGKYLGEKIYDREMCYFFPVLLNSIVNPFLYFKIMNKVPFCGKCRKGLGKSANRQLGISKSYELKNCQTTVTIEKYIYSLNGSVHGI